MAKAVTVQENFSSFNSCFVTKVLSELAIRDFAIV